MKIDLSKATLAWLEAWKAKKIAKPQGSFYSTVEITQAEAYRQYIMEKLDIYLADFQVGQHYVTFYKSDLYHRDLVLLMRTKFVVEAGIAVIDEIEPDTYYEGYSEEASTRLEITYRVPK
jgi:hypothetical protein